VVELVSWNAKEEMMRILCQRKEGAIKKRFRCKKGDDYVVSFVKFWRV